jgi:hypothetical protein
MRFSIKSLAFFAFSALFVVASGAPAVRAQVAAEAQPSPSAAPSAASAIAAPNTQTVKTLLHVTTLAPESYAVFLKNATMEKGLINLVRKDDNLYFDLGPEDFDKTFIIAPSLASGLGAGTFAGRLYDPILVRFKREGKRVFWIAPNTEFATPKGGASAKSLAISTASSIIAASPIVAEDAATKHVAITPALLISDHLDIGKELAEAAGGGAAPAGGLILLLGGPHAGFALDPMRSYYVSTKALPHNDEITVNLTFSGNGNLETVPDTRGTPIKVHYSILEEPAADAAFQPRPADDRIGYFVETQKRFGDDTTRSPFMRYIDRWDLSKGPIVFTMTNEVPPEYRAAVKRGILAWNPAFAKVGYPNALRVDDPPTDSSFDPDDAKYNSIRWISQDRASFVAATPHIADPLTGRILRATVTIDGEALRSLRRGFVDNVVAARVPVSAYSPYAAYFSSSSALKSSAATSAQANGSAIAGLADPCLAGFCEYGDALESDAAFATLALNPNIRENSAQTTKFVDEYITAVTMHEVGHALGLRHNFAAPSVYSLSQVENPAFTAAHGISASVMAYNPVDLAPPGKPQPNFFQTRLGPYDYWAIQYGYTPNGSPADLRKIADRSSEPDHVFETDEDAAGAWGVDPRVAVFVLSSDPLGWNAQRFQIADHLLGTLDRRYPRDDRSFNDERLAFSTILNEYTRSALLTTRWVGGVFESRSHRGQPGTKAPFSPVPRSEQHRAFELLDRYVFSSRAFAFSPSLIEHLAPDRFHGWGSQGLNQRPDFPVTAFVGNVQDTVLYTIFSPTNLARINDQSLLARGKTMSLGDLFEWSRTAVFDDVATGNSIPELHRELQRRYTDLLLEIALLPSLGLDQLQIPYETQSLARYELRQVQSEIHKDLASHRIDVSTRAHLEELASRIHRGLTAENVRGI